MAHGTAAGRMDPQQNHSEGRGKLPHFAGNEAAAPYAAHPFLNPSNGTAR